MLKLNIHSTYFSFNVDFYCSDYIGSFNFKNFIYNYLTTYTYNSRTKKSSVKDQYYYYNRPKNEMRLSLQILPLFKLELHTHRVQFQETIVPLYMPDTISINMKPGYNDRPHQTEIIKYMVDSTNTMNISELQTGQGKTYIAIKSSTIFQCPVFIQCAGLLDQWKEKYLEYTDIHEDKIMVLQKIDSVIELWDRANDVDSSPHVILASIRTVINHIKGIPDLGIPPIFEILKKCGVGLKIIDEVHLNFNANIKLDLYFSIPKNIYLTATRMKSDKQTDRILDRIYPARLSHDNLDYKRYSTVQTYSYSFGLGFANRKFRGAMGYSHNKYEDYLLKHFSFYDKFYNTAFKKIFLDEVVNSRKTGDRVLIICSKIIFCETLRDSLREDFPNLVINTKLGGDPEENFESDVIISTYKSSGTGTDIPNLTRVINTLSFQSPVYAVQILGRLREIKGGDTKFIDIYNRQVEDQCRHMAIRKKLYENMSNDIRTEDMNN